MNTEQTTLISCFEHSINANEDMFATSPRTHLWILLEYNDSWEEKAFNTCKIDSEVKNHIRAFAGTEPKSRIQLIKNPNNHDGANIRLYVVITRPGETNLYEFTLSSYEDILDIDFEKSLKEKTPITKYLILICTHGSYDECCSKYGLEIFNHLNGIQSDYEIWQTTHVGGHRFAANIVILPDGIFYGRVNPDNIDSIIETHSKNNLKLNTLRGICTNDPDVQAADYLLRKQKGVTGINHIIFKSTKLAENGLITMVFKNTQSGKQYEITISKNDKALFLLASCKDKHKKYIPTYRLVEIA